MDRRVNSDRRQVELGPDEYGQTRLLEAMIDKINMISTPPQTTKGDQITFTVSQILGGLFAIITIGGSILAAWVNINNQITSQQISTNLTIEQLKKDVLSIDNKNKELYGKMDNITSNLRDSMDKLSARIGELDNTVNQLYSHISPKSK